MPTAEGIEKAERVHLQQGGRHPTACNNGLAPHREPFGAHSMIDQPPRACVDGEALAREARRGGEVGKFAVVNMLVRLG